MLSHLSPRQRKIMLAVAGAGLLGLIALISRGRSTAADSAPVTPSDGTGAVPAGSTFADNGAQAGQLSSDVATGLGNVANALGDIQTNLPSDVAAAVSATLPATEPVQAVPAQQDPASVAAAVGAAVGAALSTPRGRATAPGKRRSQAAKAKQQKLYDWGDGKGAVHSRPKRTQPPRKAAPRANAHSRARANAHQSPTRPQHQTPTPPHKGNRRR